MRVLTLLCCAIAFAVGLTPNARADEWNKQTYLTFSAPVQVPGVTLPAGTYMFKLADLASSRHVVQVFDKTGRQIYATILAIPDERLEPSDKTVVMFAETPRGTPAAIKAWFYPGRTIGDEFVYPRSEAVRIARATHGPVLSMPDQSMHGKGMKSAQISRVNESGQPAEEGKLAATTGTSGAGARRPAQLPGTASSLPLLELMSVLAFAGAFGIRRLRKRVG